MNAFNRTVSYARIPTFKTVIFYQAIYQKNMKKTKLFFVGAAILIWGGTAVHAQSWRNGGAVSSDKRYPDYPCVNLLDSTSVTEELPDKACLRCAGP